jgi:hypothetical protein
MSVRVWVNSQVETPRHVPWDVACVLVDLDLRWRVYGTSRMPELTLDTARTLEYGPALTGNVAV